MNNIELYKAVRLGQMGRVMKAIGDGGDNFMNSLIIAAEYGHIDILQEMLNMIHAQWKIDYRRSATTHLDNVHVKSYYLHILASAIGQAVKNQHHKCIELLQNTFIV
jgi:hypothetical protein